MLGAGRNAHPRWLEHSPNYLAASGITCYLLSRGRCHAHPDGY